MIEQMSDYFFIFNYQFLLIARQLPGQSLLLMLQYREKYLNVYCVQSTTKYIILLPKRQVFFLTIKQKKKCHHIIMQIIVKYHFRQSYSRVIQLQELKVLQKVMAIVNLKIKLNKNAMSTSSGLNIVLKQ